MKIVNIATIAIHLHNYAATSVTFGNQSDKLPLDHQQCTTNQGSKLGRGGS